MFFFFFFFFLVLCVGMNKYVYNVIMGVISELLLITHCLPTIVYLWFFGLVLQITPTNDRTAKTKLLLNMCF
jgi:hypothetical protein